MNQFLIFTLRVIIGGVFAVVISKVFRPDAGPVFAVLLGVFFVGFSYLLEYYRKRKP